MARSPYIYALDGELALIKQPTVAKHEVLRHYLVDYIQTLVSSPNQDELRLTLVDGFAGAGEYLHEVTRERRYGSPFVFLQAAKEAEMRINTSRRKKIRMNLDYFFVEKDPIAVELLRRSLHNNDYGPQLDQGIRVINGLFQDNANAISEFIAKKSPRSGRSIFLLDQYGYKDVPTSLIRTILAKHASAEVILTFGVDSFINFAGDNVATHKQLNNIGIPDVLRGRTFEDIKQNENDFRLYIQSCLYKDLVSACGARYYTLFFIRTEGHGDYWLVHLSQHPRARDVMTRVHWSKNNNFIHYGGAGIDMFQVLGYSAERDTTFTGQQGFGFCFDNHASNASVQQLMEQLPQIIYANPQGISFGDLFASTCNTSPADSAKYKDALEQLIQFKDIKVVSAKGTIRGKASTIGDSDHLLPASQHSFGFTR